MRIFLIIGEDHFYHPNFVADLIKQSNHEIVGAALITKPPKKADLQGYLLKHIYYLNPGEILKLILKTVEAIILDRLKPKTVNDNGFYSVKSVFETFKIPYFIVESNINKSEYLDQIRDKTPDVIISSNPYIFRKELLTLPKLACINRHSSLLPAYGGLWPVFQAVSNGEKYTGVTIHTMVEEIDKGLILSQKKVLIENKSVFDLYKETFGLSVEAVIESLAILSRYSLERLTKDPIIKIETNNTSYFSTPSKSNWENFRKNHGKFI